MKTTTVLSTKVHKYTPELLWWMQLNYFVSHIFKTFSENKGVRLVFGRYSLPSSLKRDTWTKGQKGKEAQKTIKAGQQNRGWVVVVGGQNAWEQEKIFLAPKQTRGVDAEIILHAMDATARVTTFSQHRGLLLGSQTLFKSLQAPLLSPVLEGTIKKLFFGKKKKMELIYWWEYGAEKTRIN